MTRPRTVVVAVCGASGVIYGIRLLTYLLEHPGHRVMLMVSRAGRAVLAHECGLGPEMTLQEFLSARGIRIHGQSSLEVFDTDQIGAPPASGSFRHSGMVIAPCSMKTLASIAAGMADTLIPRSADVCLKEKRPLILLPRETPLNLIHLENMTRACRAGATIMPPCPSFYSSPKTLDQLVDTVTARILDHLGVDHDLVPQWSGCNL